MKTLGLLWGYVWLIQHLKRMKTSDEDTNFLYVVEAIASLHMRVESPRLRFIVVIYSYTGSFD